MSQNSMCDKNTQRVSVKAGSPEERHWTICASGRVLRLPHRYPFTLGAVLLLIGLLWSPNDNPFPTNQNYVLRSCMHWLLSSVKY